jgi:hypothetical protein
LPGTASLDEVIAVIERDGGVIVEDFLPPAIVAELKADLLPQIEACSAGRDDFSGFRTRRMSALFAKSRRVADLVTHPLLLGTAEHFINRPIVYGSGEHVRSVRPGLRIGGTQMIQIGPGEGAQPLHRDPSRTGRRSTGSTPRDSSRAAGITASRASGPTTRRRTSRRSYSIPTATTSKPSA